MRLMARLRAAWHRLTYWLTSGDVARRRLAETRPAGRTKKGETAMRDFYVGRFCVRLWRRPAGARLYFSRRYTVASIGVGPLGVQIMRVITQVEVDATNAAATRPPARVTTTTETAE